MPFLRRRRLLRKRRRWLGAWQRSTCVARTRAKGLRTGHRQVQVRRLYGRAVLRRLQAISVRRVHPLRKAELAVDSALLQS